ITACRARLVFGFCRNLAARNAAVIVGIGSWVEQGTEAQVCATRLHRQVCALWVRRNSEPNPQPHFDRGIVWVEIRCCTLPVLEEARREATMGSSPTPPQISSLDDSRITTMV